MKRSEVNKIMRDAEEFLAEMKCPLPPFAFWTPEEWAEKGSEYNEIKENAMGWDITDFGSGDYYKKGLLMFTTRCGSFDEATNVKPYAEKIMIVEEEQITPYHLHWNRIEDIINRGGGNLLVSVYNCREDNDFADTPVHISIDGRNYELPAGEVIRLVPGESITLFPGQYHKFWGEKGTGKVLLGEIASVESPLAPQANQFHEETKRFPPIEEDEAPLHLQLGEYPPVN